MENLQNLPPLGMEIIAIPSIDLTTASLYHKAFKGIFIHY